MSLNFTKLPYVDGETVIPASNLNAIQDALLNLDDNKVEKEQGKGLSTNDYTNEEKAKVTAATQATQETTLGPAAIATFDASAADMPLKALTVDIEPVQSGSGDPSPENVRPISGWTGCNVTRTGKNLFDFANADWVSGSLIDLSGAVISNGNYRYCRNYNPIHGGKVITVSFIRTGGATALGNPLAFYDKDKNFLERISTVAADGVKGRVSKNISVPSGAAYYRLNIANEISEISDYMIEYGDTPTTYEPFGNTYPITFPASAGTVYGGTLDVVNGKLTVDRAKVTITDAAILTMGGNIAYFRPTPRPEYPALMPPVSDAVTSVIITSNQYIRFNDALDDETAEAYLTRHGGSITVVYDVAPIVYNLSDVPEILTLYGTNNIWAETGDVTVSYGAYLETVKAHAERLGDSILSAIAPMETTYTASRAYAVGEFLFVGTKFYKVISAIAEGGTITPGTNVEETTVAEQLMTLAVKPTILG